MSYKQLLNSDTCIFQLQSAVDGVLAGYRGLVKLPFSALNVPPQAKITRPLD